jgi:hypothetical protein
MKVLHVHFWYTYFTLYMWTASYDQSFNLIESFSDSKRCSSCPRDLPSDREQRQRAVGPPRRVHRSSRRFQKVVEGQELARARRARPAHHRCPRRWRTRHPTSHRASAVSKASAQLVAADLRLVAERGEGKQARNLQLLLILKFFWLIDIFLHEINYRLL